MSSNDKCEYNAASKTATKSAQAATKSSFEAFSSTTPDAGKIDKKSSDRPFYTFTTREMRSQYSVLPDGSIVENIGRAQKYICHIDDLDLPFRVFIHNVPHETKYTTYSTVCFISSMEESMKQQVYSILYFHKNLKTIFADEAEKWLTMMKNGVRVFISNEGLTTIDHKKEKFKTGKKAAKHTGPKHTVPKHTGPKHTAPKYKATKPNTSTATVEKPKITFAVAPAPKVNAWTKSLTEPTEPQSEDSYEGRWVTVGEKKSAPKYFICIERGFSLKVQYDSSGVPHIFQMMPDGKSKEIGWIKEMSQIGFQHLRTPEGHHIFFKNSRLKVALMTQCLDYTIKNSSDEKQIEIAKDVLTWPKKFIIKDSESTLQWAKTYKTKVVTEEKNMTSEMPSLVGEEFPQLGEV